MLNLVGGKSTLLHFYKKVSFAACFYQVDIVHLHFVVFKVTEL